MNRAFHIGGLVWFAAVLAAGTFGWDPLICAGIGAAVFAALLLKGRLPLWTYSAAAAFCACMLSLAVYHALAVEPAARWEGTRRVRAVVTDRADYGSYARLSLTADREGMPAGLSGARIQVSAPAALAVAPGDVVEWELKLEVPEAERKRLWADGFRFRGTVSGAPAVVGERPGGLRVALAEYRSGIRQNILHELPNEYGELLAALVTGRTEGLSPELRYDYSRAGISHLLAVSGLHLSVFVALIDALLAACFLSRRQRGIAEIAAVLFLMGLTGFSHSVVRAGVMLIVCRAALLCGRDSDTLNSLGFAVVLMLLCNPDAAFSTGLQLSYLATMGIAAASGPMAGWFSKRLCGVGGFTLEETRPKAYALLSMLSATLCAQLFTAPVLCWRFGQISLVSPLVNLIVAPAVPFALAGGLLCGFAGFLPVLAVPARFFGLVGGVSVRAITETAQWWSRFRFAALPLRSDWLVLWMGACLLGGAVLAALRVKPAARRQAAALSALALTAGAFSQSLAWGNTMEIALPENGSAVAVAYHGQGALIGVPDSLYEARNLRAFFRDHGVERIDLLAARREADLRSNPALLLLGEVPADAAFGLDRTYGFSAELFGCAGLAAEGRDAETLRLEAGNLRIVKEFTQSPQEADLLVNAKNELVAAPGVAVKPTDRYFGSVVVTLRIP